MKEISELVLPDDVRYAQDHEWAKPENDRIRVGISDYAQDQLGDVVFVEMPKVGEKFAKDDPFGTVESVKAVSELFMPVAGEIVGVNNALEDSPELVNNSPYTEGWIILIQPDNTSELNTLMDKEAYLTMLKGTEE